MSTGMICPRWFSVAALYALQKSMMLMPCGPNAVPTGGAGVAPPAWIWIFTTAASFFFAISIAPFTANRALPAALVDSIVAVAIGTVRGRSLRDAHSAGTVRGCAGLAFLLWQTSAVDPGPDREEGRQS